jgi:hypothetical protein
MNPLLQPYIDRWKCLCVHIYTYVCIFHHNWISSSKRPGNIRNVANFMTSYMSTKDYYIS